MYNTITPSHEQEIHQHDTTLCDLGNLTYFDEVLFYDTIQVY